MNMTPLFADKKHKYLTHAVFSLLTLLSFNTFAETTTATDQSDILTSNNRSIMLKNYDPVDSGVGRPSQTFKKTPHRQEAESAAKMSPSEKHNQEVWDHVLPFGGQTAIYNGYNLPLPFGISLLYSHVKQHQNISNMKVGYNGSSSVGNNQINTHISPQNIDPSLFRFDNFETDTQTPQLKIDAWVLPFLNVFATVGKLSGTTDLGMVLGGDQLLSQMPQCQPGRPGLVCRQAVKLISDKLDEHGIQLAGDHEADMTIDIEGYSYTYGAMIAGATGDWFYTMPISYTQTHMKKASVDGGTINIQPRIGYNFELLHGYKLSLYTGASYMQTKQTISGSYKPGDTAVPDQDQAGAISFQVDQQNQSPWTGVVGFNININQYFSAAFESSGIAGDRNQYVIMVNGRF
ncbi:hypothetical protein HC725_15485 [Vibrio sp. S17_S38]|uniref:hypothetical protein n=1 Tax=Vibrio sp. S17_S38 TaxID=2720229 RepID=UPI001680E182|nr:hypothetical protein [Vibrio sp. S17_S38]MBD1574660.1 hypothetical protein [Vibrio sp. S17_S38]